MTFDEWWNSADADSYRAHMDGLHGEDVRRVWDAAMAAAAARKLTDHEIAMMKGARAMQDGNDDSPWWLLFARDVERAAQAPHGEKEEV